MLICRKIKWKNLRTFKDFVDEFCKFITRKQHDETKRIDLVFDDYFENSPKSSERIRRADKEAIKQHVISAGTPLPSIETKFWSSSKNKELSQLFITEYILQNAQIIWPEIEVVFSTIKNEECISTKLDFQKNVSSSILQRFDIEEADVKIMLHIAQSSISGNRKILLLSSDTDVLGLALNFWSTFIRYGLKVKYIILCQ